MRRLLVAAILLLAALGSAAAQRGNPVLEWQGQSIDRMIAEFMAAEDIPGLSLAIVQAPYIPRATGHGLAEVETRRLVSTSTLFDLGRMSEAYIAVAIMQLAESGQLSLEDPLGRHLPHLPPSWAAVPLGALLRHASGLPDYREAPGFDPAMPLGAAALVAAVADRPPAFAPYAGAADSATNYLLLAVVVEEASRTTLEAFIGRHQIERLGLRHTAFSRRVDRLPSERLAPPDHRHAGFLSDPALIAPPERARGYRRADPDGAVLVPAAPAGEGFHGRLRLWASATDVSIWDIGLAGGVLVREPANRAILYGPQRLSDGTMVPATGAWRFPGRPGLMLTFGTGHGQSAFLSRFTDPGELVCVTLLVNREGVDLTDLARRIAGAFDPRLGPPGRGGVRWQETPYGPSETLARWRAAGGGADLSATVLEAEGQVWLGLVPPTGRAARDRAAATQWRAVSPW
jgi:CubicO group peptidase (beta-lactamase class C family)